MSLSTTEAVRETFRRASREALQKSLRTPEDWDRYIAHSAEASDRLVAEERSFARDYRARLAEAKEAILREEHGVRLDQPLPPGVAPTSDAQTLTRKADARVHRDHQRRRAAILQDELDGYRDLTAEIRARDAPDGPSRDGQAPARRRSNPDRN